MKKLLRDPVQFVVDMKVLRPFMAYVSPLMKRGQNNFKPAVAQSAAPLTLDVPGLKGFDLLGENWLDEGAKKPVAVLWNFNYWKRGFVSSYLHEYRTAYADKNPRISLKLIDIQRFPDMVFIVWGKSEDSRVSEFAERHGIPLYRMEDGFIRSVSLGSQHTTALSLALDKTGIYFDATTPSDLENLLAEHDFSAQPRLLEAAGALRRLMASLKLSKYSLGSLCPVGDLLGPRLKRRVLVLGQVEDDASIRYGLAEGWTNRRLIELAYEENPGAEIIYKPHPDVAAGYRAKSSEVELLQEICTIISHGVVLADLFEEVDHVYTITSLSGFEALIHGLSVTVVGAPFYAGWGLTDDRAPLARRNRTLSLDELFCAAYLLYPRYLTGLHDPVTGCLAAMLQIAADRQRQEIAMVSPKTIERRIEWVSTSYQWPALLSPRYFPGALKLHGKNLLGTLPLGEAFSLCKEDIYQRSLAYLLAGRLKETVLFRSLLGALRGYLSTNNFSALIADLWQVSPSDTLLGHWAWLAEQEYNIAAARESLNHAAWEADPAKAQGSKASPPFKYAQVLELARFELRQRNLEVALSWFNRLLLNGYCNGDVLSGVAEIARLRFQFQAAAELLKFFNALEPAWKNGNAYLLEAQAQNLSGSSLQALLKMAVACRVNPQYFESFPTVEDTLEKRLGVLPYAQAMLAANELDNAGTVLARAKALIAAERSDEAEKLLSTYKPTRAETIKYSLMLSMAYGYQGKLDQAKDFISKLLHKDKSILLFREGLRLAVLKNDYAWGKSLLLEASARGLDVGDIYHRKIALGLGDIKSSYLSFRLMRAHKTLKAYLGGKYVQSLDLMAESNNDERLITAFFGPGDEIRFASLYREMRARCGDSQVRFTCDPRLLGLLQRHYTELEFVPTQRIRSLAGLPDYTRHDQLPGSDLHTFFDNAGWQAAQEADKVILTTDALGDVIDGYPSFSGQPYLKADLEQIAVWRERLRPCAGKPLVGLSWRSSLTTYSRNEHYVSIEDLAPVLALDGIQFVNLQYDECSEELAWAERHFPGKLLNFTDLDQYNDLDGVAALMNCLDLIIAPATTVVELAGALGRPTLMLSNSSELHWRKLPGTMIDVWHRSITHVEARQLGDKSSLIDVLAQMMISLFFPEGEPITSPRDVGIYKKSLGELNDVC
ncbi:capsular polysaccharide export protein, LipB/KpsS family [Vogesella indigofera]|uniref:capsular polysaccharide export protein, LipB/KpsS family n=1 Tax=Vogesella indigofera TaxID=45465 RepID=UPI0035AFE865